MTLVNLLIQKFSLTLLSSWSKYISDLSDFINLMRCSILALMELTFQLVIFINYNENEVPQPHEEDAWGFVILKVEPISSST